MANVTPTPIEDAAAFLSPSVLRMVTNPKIQSPRETFDATRLKTNLTSSPRPVPPPGSPELLSNKVCTDHMISIRWTSEQGWTDPELVPYGPLSLMPTASVIHYSTACFEGMKVYRGADGTLRLFRPGYNCGRMLASALRICLPGFDPRQLLALIKKLCAVDGPKWLPKDGVGQSLYLRPTFIGSDPCLGFQVPQEAMLFIIISYWPPPPSAKKGLELLCSVEDMVRAWPGSAGSAKISGNYGPSLLAHDEAKRNGFDQVLWLFGSEGYVTEAGSSNFFAIWRTEGGKLQLITAPLTEHTILAGVTRKSVLELTETRLDQAGASKVGIEPLEAVEANFTISELAKASEQGRLLGTFVVGTACFMQLVVRIQYKERVIEIPTDDIPHMAVLLRWMSDILLGNNKSEWIDVISEE
ncbi:Aminotransferase class IV [Penicillium coprophilum]|uniref:Aminotransferase class IV n=1 Tax=Penicillium coprophilum TaxID=36646 RepID=UPI00238DCB78|nr:Aminotransferase class IV [Penicillium coprophilum]KAJ5158032.1 Aminotransferase class IV [Penicillium coprophilum]